MLSTVLYDYDNTLGKTELEAFIACCELVNDILAGNGVPVTLTAEQLMKEFVGKTFRQIMQHLGEKHGFYLTEETLARYVLEEEERVIVRLSAHMEPAPGVNAVLAELQHRLSQAVVSSSALRRLQACLIKGQQSSFFQQGRIFSAASSLATPTPKPDPAIYLHALAVLGVQASECVAVEDSLTGAESAIRAGIRVIGYVGALPEDERKTRAAALLKAGATTVIYHWSEFPAVLATM